MREGPGFGQAERKSLSNWPLPHPLTTVTWAQLHGLQVSKDSEGRGDQVVSHGKSTWVRTSARSDLPPASHQVLLFQVDKAGNG